MNYVNLNYTNYFDKLSTIASITESRHVFNYYVARQFANTIANIAPKVNFKNEQLTTLGKTDQSLNKFLKLNYEVVRRCSLYGSVFVGIVPTKTSTSDKYVPYFSVGVPLDYEYIGPELTKLVIVVDVVRHNGVPFFLIEEGDIDKNFFHRALCSSTGGRVGSEDNVNFNSKLNNQNSGSPFFKTIPYVQFYANPEGQPDLNDVPKAGFEQFDLNMKILRTDSVVSKGLVVTNPGLAYNISNLDKLAQALQDPDKLAFEYQGVGSVVGDQVFNIVQGQSYAQSIITKLRFIEELIKKIGFVRTDTQNMGTKNTIISEVENINADADDYLEMKANLLEESGKKFFEVAYIPYYVNMKVINSTVEDVDVEVSGSTKYLRNPVNKYVQNQVGTLFNPNDLTKTQTTLNKTEPKTEPAKEQKNDKQYN